MYEYLYLFVLGLLPFIEPRYAIFSMYLLKINVYIGFLILLIDILILSFLPFVLQVLEQFILKVTGKNKIISKIYNEYLNYLRNKSRNIIKKYGLIGLFLYVLVPIPMTGIWSGAFISYIFNIDWKKAYIALFLGGLCSFLLVLFGITIL